MSLNATSAGEMGRKCDGLSPAESAEDAEEALLRKGDSAKPNPEWCASIREDTEEASMSTETVNQCENDLVGVAELSLIKLFKLPLCIPDYQRGYCWEKKHVESLLESLGYADVEDADDDVGKSDNKYQYHLGTVILHKHKRSKYCKGCKSDEESCGDVYDVVDGQQRLLTLSLIAGIIWDNSPEICLPLLDSTTQDQDVIRHVYDNAKTIKEWIACHPNDCDALKKMLTEKLVFTVVTILASASIQDSPLGIDPSLQLAWTFFNAVNSGGKKLSDYDLLKAHHLRHLSNMKDEALTQYKASKWDSDGEERIITFNGVKVNLYESLLAHTAYLIRSWLRNRRVQVFDFPADEKYCVLNHYSALLSFASANGTMSNLTNGVIGGKQFFDWTEYYTWKYRRFCENPVVSRFLSVPWKPAQSHILIIARAILFYYFCKFGDVYLADACIFILYRIGRLRNRSARSKDSWYGNREDEKCVPHTIEALDESPSPEYFFRYCQLPSNRYVRYYNLKNGEKTEDGLLESWRYGPDWWKRFLGFASSSIDKSIPALRTKEELCIGDSICYKKEIADLLQDPASDFGWEFNKETLVLSLKQIEQTKENENIEVNHE